MNDFFTKNEQFHKNNNTKKETIKENEQENYYPMAYAEDKEDWGEKNIRKFLEKFFINLKELKILFNNTINESFILFLIREIYKIIYFLKNKDEIYFDFNLKDILFYKKFFEIRLSNYNNKIKDFDYSRRKDEILKKFNEDYGLTIKNDTINSFKDLKHLQNYSLGINIKNLINLNDVSENLKTFIEKLIKIDSNGNLNTEFDINFLNLNEYDFDKIIRINQYDFCKKDFNQISEKDLIFTIKQINNIKKLNPMRRRKFFFKNENIV